MDYKVLVVEDDQLPADTDWALARVDCHIYLLIKRSRFSLEGGLCELLEEVWEARTAAAWVSPPLALAI